MNFIFIQYFILLFYIKSKEIKKYNTAKNIFQYVAKTVELTDFDVRTLATSEHFPFFISKDYSNQTIGYSFSFDLKTFNYEKEVITKNDYETLSLLLNPFTINATVVGKSKYDKYKNNNFSECSFEISGIFDMVSRHGSLFFSIDNVTKQLEETNYLIVKIDLDRKVYDSFKTQNTEFEVVCSRIYYEKISLTPEHYYSSHIFNELMIGKPYITTFYLKKEAQTETKMLIEFSKRSQGLTYDIQSTSSKNYEIIGKNVTLGKEIIYINIENLNVGDEIIFSVYLSKKEDYKFSQNIYSLLEDFVIKYELYDKDQDEMYEYKTQNEFDIDPYQEDSIPDSHLEFLIPSIRQYKLGDSKGFILKGYLYLRVFYVSEEDFQNGILDYMDSINPQIIKPFYVRQFFVDDSTYVTKGKEYIFKNYAGNYIVDAIFKSNSGDYFHYPAKHFILTDLGKPKDIDVDYTYIIKGNNSGLYGHFVHSTNQGFLSLKVNNTLEYNYAVVYAHYYNDCYGPIELVLLDQNRQIQIYGETEFANSIYIPYKYFYNNQQMYLRITCVRECDIVLESALYNYYTDYYDSYFFYTLEVFNTLNVTYKSEYYKYKPTNLIVFSDYKLPNISVNYKEITDPTIILKNDFFKCVFLDLSKFQQMTGVNILDIAIDSEIHTNISIYQNYRDAPYSVNWTMKYANSTPTIYNYIKNGSICDDIYINPLMRSYYVIRILCDSDAVFKSINSYREEVEIQLKAKEMHVLKHPDVSKIDAERVHYCIYTVDTKPAMYSLQVITNRDQQNSFAVMDSLYLNVLYEDFLSSQGVRVFTLGELSSDEKQNYLCNITLKQGKGIEVYRVICDTYPVCVYNETKIKKLDNVKTIKEYKKNEFYDIVKHNTYSSLDPSNNYVYIVVCKEPHTGCLYEFQISETTKTKVDFDSGVSKWLIVFIVLIILIGAGFCLYWFYFRKKRHEIRISKLQEDIENIDKKGINENTSEM